MDGVLPFTPKKAPMGVCHLCHKSYPGMAFCPEHGAALTPIPGSSNAISAAAHHSAPTQFAAEKVKAAAANDPGLPLAATVSPATPLPRSGANARPITESPPEENPDNDAWIGQEMGNFRLTRLLGIGGMGAVYLAEHNRLPKKAAVKLLKREFAALPEVSVRFDQEARAAAEIGHDNVVQIFDFGQRQDGTAYLVMEYLEGKSLAGYLRQAGAIPPARLYEILRPICLGLFAAHERKIVHRDLKPDNIFLSQQPSDEGGFREVVKILDFGIAKVSSALSKSNGPQTGTGMILGTPFYMSPEQAEGGQIDLRSDIYSLGIIMYEMLTGRVPFNADTFGKILLKHIGEEPVSLRQARPDAGIPAALDKLVLRCLAKDPNDRPKDTKELLSQLEAAIPLTDTARGYAAPLAPKKSKLGVMLGVGVASVAALIVGAFALGGGKNNTPTNAPTPITEPPKITPEPSSQAAAPEPIKARMVQLLASPAAAVFRPDESQPIGHTPFAVSLPSVGQTTTLLLRAEGFEDRSITLTGNEPEELRIELRPVVALDVKGAKNPKDPKITKHDPKTDPPKNDPVVVVEPKTDPPKTDPPKTDPPKTDPPKTDPKDKPIEKIQDGHLVDPFKKKKP